MEIKRAPIKVQDYDKAVHVDMSVSHWAQEHTRLSAAAMQALSTYQNLVDAKNQIVMDLVKASGFDFQRAVQARLVKEGDATFVEVTLHDGPLPNVSTAQPGPSSPEAPPAPPPEPPPAPPAPAS